MVGILGILSNLNEANFAMFLGTSFVGPLAMYNTYLNAPRGDGSLIDELNEENYGYYVAINKALEEIYKKIPNTPNLEIEGR